LADVGMGARCDRSSIRLLRRFGGEARVEVEGPLLGIGLIERWGLGSGIVGVRARSGILLGLCLMYLGIHPLM
jgi:hypothetical protein